MKVVRTGARCGTMKTSSSSNHLAMLDSLRSPGSPTAPAVRERTDSVGSNREDVTSTSRVGAAFTTFACSISGGLLTLPAVFAHAALAPAMILCSLAGVSCIFSLLALIMCADLNPRLRNYGHLLGWFGGVKMEKAMLGIIGLFLTGALGGTFIIVHDYMVEVFGTGLYGNGATTLAASFVALVALPKDVGKLVYAGTCSVMGFCFLVFTLFEYAENELASQSASNPTPWPWWPVKNSSIYGPPPVNGVQGGYDVWYAVANSFPPLFYVFGCQFQIFDIFFSVESGRLYQLRRNRLNHGRVLDTVGNDEKSHGQATLYFLPVIIGACSMMCCMFILVGFCGVIAFPDHHIKGDVLQMLVGRGNLGAVARGVVVSAMLLASPLLVNPTRHFFASVLRYVCCQGSRRRTQGALFNFLLTFGVVGMSLSLALSGLNFLSIVSIMGAFLGAPLFFILPGITLVSILSVNVNEDSHWLLEEHAAHSADQMQERSSAIQTQVRLIHQRKKKWLSPCAQWTAWLMGIYLCVVGMITLALSVYKFFC